jgi:hypothetical protein
MIESIDLIPEFCHEINTDNNLTGDIIEFGTGSGNSAEVMNSLFNGNKKIFTFDGFAGLPKTHKVVPQNSGWHEGGLFHSEEQARLKLKNYKNIVITKTMMSDLQDPSYYGIKKVAGANMDLDLYEGTRDALNFLDKMDWKNVLLRFDDWGANPYQSQKEYDEHEKTAFYEFVQQKNYSYRFYNHYNTKVKHFLNVIVCVFR